MMSRLGKIGDSKMKPYDEVFVFFAGAWHKATWDESCVGVWLNERWRNMGSFDAYMYSY